MSIGRSARRLLIVCAATAVCGALGAGPAAAATTEPTDLLGLGQLLNSLKQQPAATTNSTTQSPTLGSALGTTLTDLPVLGPVVTPVVKALPILNSPTPAKHTAPAAATTPTPDTAKRTTVQPAAPTGSTWTAPRTATTDPAPVIPPSHGSGIDPAQIVPKLMSLLPTAAASKAEVGAAAVALIILGGVAVAGAAGAAGAAGRRQFIGGPW
jgi:hypothetical protein